MIITILLRIYLAFISFLVGTLPTGGLPSGVSSGITGFFQYVYQFNNIFPIDTALTLLGFTAIFWGIIFSWDLVKWMIHLIRGN